MSVKDFSGGILDLSRTRFIPPSEHKVLYQRCDPRRGDILIARIGTLGRAVLVDTDVEFSLFVSVGLVRFDRQCVNPEFLRVVLNSPFAEAEFDRIKIGGGTHTNKLNLGDLHTVAIPLPPIAEQRRIVAKVDELMALCDRLCGARTKQETIRNQLATASLARLNAPHPDPAMFQNHAAFALDNLTHLTTRPEQIRGLRQTILNLAVRGKLVAQHPDDELAVDFDSELPTDFSRPFAIPKTWNWARLRALGRIVGGGTPSKARDDYWGGGIPWVSPKDMKIDHLSDAQMSVTDAAIAGSAANIIPVRSVLFVIRGMILAHSFPVAVTRVPVAINQDMKALVLRDTDMADYMLLALKGLKPEMLRRVLRSSHGTCRIERSDYMDFMVPVPPFAEQRRIAAKVDELMSSCDRLEDSLVIGVDIRRRLLDAVLHDALEQDADSKAAA